MLPEITVSAAAIEDVRAASCLAPCALPPTTAGPPLPVGIRIGEVALQDHVGVADKWWDAEPFGRWTGAKTAPLSVVLPETTTPLSLALELSTYREGVFTLRLNHLAGPWESWAWRGIRHTWLT